MSRNAVAIVSSLLFALLAALLIITPVPYVTWRPGRTIDVLGSTESGAVIEIGGGVPTYPSEGRLLMTTVSATRVDATVSLPEAVFVHLANGSDAIPRDVVFPPGKSIEQVRQEATLQMDHSRTHATVAALAAAGIPVEKVPSVGTVSLTGPAADKLLPGDFLKTVDGQPVDTVEGVETLISRRNVGDTLMFGIVREGVERTVAVGTVASNSDPRRAVVGVTLAVGYQFAPKVSFGVDQSVTGPSAGLVFALGIYDRITEGDLLGGRVVAGTGTVDANGQVGGISGIREKITGAERDGASVFLVPQRNCLDIGDFDTEMTLVSVDSLKDAVAALQLINEGSTSEVPTCG